MNVDEAVREAKSYVQKVFADENVAQIRLEEVEFDDTSDVWLVTIGITRPAAEHGSSLVPAPLKRTYRVVRIADDRSGIPSVKIRDLAIDD